MNPIIFHLLELAPLLLIAGLVIGSIGRYIQGEKEYREYSTDIRFKKLFERRR